MHVAQILHKHIIGLYLFQDVPIPPVSLLSDIRLIRMP